MTDLTEQSDTIKMSEAQAYQMRTALNQLLKGNELPVCGVHASFVNGTVYVRVKK